MTDKFAELTLVIIIAGAALALFSNMSKRSFLKDNHWNGEIVALTIITLISMVSFPLIDATLPWLDFADLHYYNEVAWLGLIKGILGLWLLHRAVRDYSATGEPQKKIVAKGIYRFIRYPFYSALLALVLAQLLLTQNWLAGVAGLITFALVYCLRVPRQEEDGLEKYGHHYLEYMSQTGDIWPRIPFKH